MKRRYNIYVCSKIWYHQNSILHQHCPIQITSWRLYTMFKHIAHPNWPNVILSWIRYPNIYIYILCIIIYIYISLYYHTPLVCFFPLGSLQLGWFDFRKHVVRFRAHPSFSDTEIQITFSVISPHHHLPHVGRCSKPKNLQPDLLPIFQVTQK